MGRGRGSRKITMDDIAGKLGISKNSVSLALNNKRGVSDELRKRVLEVARELNYGSYSAQDTERSACVVTVVPEYLQNDSFFYFEVFWAVDNEIKNRGHISIHTAVTTGMEKNLAMPEWPGDMRVLGFLVIGVLREEYILMLKSKGYPVLTVDISYRDSGVSSVCSANLGGGYMAAKHLIDQGHEKIGFVGPIHFASSVYERFCGFNYALMLHHLEQRPGLNILGDPDRPCLFDTLDDLQPCFNALQEYPTAWFCAGDRIAFALMNILSARNIAVPDDISVIGFDDIPLAQMVMPRLTTVSIDRKQMGRLAVERLLEGFDDTNAISLRLQGRLVVRDSVKKRL